jgi:hypothetical protein
LLQSHIDPRIILNSISKLGETRCLTHREPALWLPIPYENSVQNAGLGAAVFRFSSSRIYRNLWSRAFENGSVQPNVRIAFKNKRCG